MCLYTILIWYTQVWAMKNKAHFANGAMEKMSLWTVSVWEVKCGGFAPLDFETVARNIIFSSSADPVQMCFKKENNNNTVLCS